MRRCTTIICFFLLLLTSCSKSDEDVVDRLNEKSYDFHYRNLDSTRIYADSALSLSNDYSAGRAEALNNLAFVETAAMNYGKAKLFLDSIQGITNNQIELLISDVQQMKLCQKQSHNKDSNDGMPMPCRSFTSSPLSITITPAFSSNPVTK